MCSNVCCRGAAAAAVVAAALSTKCIQPPLTPCASPPPSPPPHQVVDSKYWNAEVSGKRARKEVLHLHTLSSRTALLSQFAAGCTHRVRRQPRPQAVPPLALSLSLPLTTPPQEGHQRERCRHAPARHTGNSIPCAQLMMCVNV